jgi:preprotein translocase subunit SecE
MLTKIYKPGQGKYTRLGSGFSAGAIVAWGCYRLYDVLSGTDWSLYITTMVPVVIAVALCTGIYWLMNKPAVADFMIASEGELKKVNWSSRKEVAVSTLIVIVVVFAMGILLGVTDLIFSTIFRYLIG